MTLTSGIQGITEADIANYLANTPGFFERHAELLGSVQLASPHGQRAVSLQERQMQMLRDKIRGLEARIIEMIRHAQENVSIAERLHRWTRVLMVTPDAAALPDELVAELMHQFLIPQAAVRVWGAATAFASAGFAQPVGDDVKAFSASLAAPYCGVNSGFEAAQWLADAAAAKSMALIPLRHHADTLAIDTDDAGAGRAGDAPDAAPGAPFGLLVLASPDPTRYSAEMGTDFLALIGEIASAALTRVLPARG